MKRLLVDTLALLFLSACGKGVEPPLELEMGSLRILIEEVAQEPGTEDNFIVLRGTIANTAIRDEISPMINTYISDETVEGDRREFSSRVSTFPDTREMFLSKEDGEYPFELVFDYGDYFDVSSVDVVIVGLSKYNDLTFSYDFNTGKFTEIE